MPAFEYRQAEEVRDALRRHGVRYLFIGKSAAILLGFPDTTQDADIYVEKNTQNGEALVGAVGKYPAFPMIRQKPISRMSRSLLTVPSA